MYIHAMWSCTTPIKKYYSNFIHRVEQAFQLTPELIFFSVSHRFVSMRPFPPKN